MKASKDKIVGDDKILLIKCKCKTRMKKKCLADTSKAGSLLIELVNICKIELNSSLKLGITYEICS
jgi:hypothetical protein